MASKSPPIDLGDDPEQTAFRLNGKEFACFPLDEIDSLNAAAEQQTPPATQGERFLEVIQKRLLDKYGIAASLDKSGQWYQALHNANEDQKSFFDESLVSSASTGQPQGGSTGEESSRSTSGTKPNTGSLKSSKSRSRPKK